MTTKKKKKRRKHRSKAPILILALVLLAAGGAAFAGWKITNSDTILPNVSVGNVDIGKMTRQEAVSALKNGGWEQRATTPLKVSLLNAVSFDVDPVRAGAVLDVDTAVDAAFSYGHDGNIMENLISWIKSFSGQTDINEQFRQENRDYVSSCIADGFQKLDAYFGAEECTLNYEEEQLTTTKGFGQIRFNEEDLTRVIREALDAGTAEVNYETLAEELVIPDFAAIDAGLNKMPVDAKYSDDGKFEVIGETDACEFNLEDARRAWTEAKPGEKITIPMKVTKPSVTGDDLRSRLYHDLLGAMTTRFTNSSDERIGNLNICIEKINGTVVYPGEVFSYNDVVGKRTEEAGFQGAPAYSNGEVVTEIGGGACQVSSTTYAATAFAFLEPVERKCHYFEVNYMQKGTDATVAWPDEGEIQDFKFKNNKNYPIKIVASIDNENRNLTVEIWGTLEDTDYMPIEFDNTYFWMQDYDRVIEKADESREGYKIKLTIIGDTYTLEDGGTGCYTHRQVFDEAGAMVEDTIINMRNNNGEIGMDEYHVHPAE